MTLAASKECEPECLNPSVKLRVLTGVDAKVLGLRHLLLVLLLFTRVFTRSLTASLFPYHQRNLPGYSHINSSANHFSMLEMDSSISYNDEEHIESASSSSSDSVPHPC